MIERREQVTEPRGSMLRDPPPRPQQDEWSERETVHPVVSAEDARDAAVGHNARYVLGFALAAVVIVFIAVYVAYFA